MTRLRHNEPVPGLFDARFAVVSLSVDYPNGHRLPFHDHHWAQVIYADRGVMQVSTHDTAWLVPPSRAIWVPADIAHGIRMRGSVRMRTLYVAPTTRGWPETCRALELSPLLRELILHLVQLEALDRSLPAHAHLVDVLADLIAGSEDVPLTTALPRDPRARVLAERILEDPSRTETLAELARDVGASQRTLQRLFNAETGASVESWRRRVRMQQSVVALSKGSSVTDAALAAGYRSASAFIGAFKRNFGVTPSRYRRTGES